MLFDLNHGYHWRETFIFDACNSCSCMHCVHGHESCFCQAKHWYAHHTSLSTLHKCTCVSQCDCCYWVAYKGVRGVADRACSYAQLSRVQFELLTLLHRHIVIAKMVPRSKTGLHHASSEPIPTKCSNVVAPVCCHHWQIKHREHMATTTYTHRRDLSITLFMISVTVILTKAIGQTNARHTHTHTHLRHHVPEIYLPR